MEESKQEMVSAANEERVISGEYDPDDDFWSRWFDLGVDALQKPLKQGKIREDGSLIGKKCNESEPN